MVSAIGSALSGLAAAGKRFEVSATNVANQFSTKKIVNGQEVNEPYTPQRVQQLSLDLGGVQTRLQDVNPPSVKVFNPEHVDAGPDGGVQFPNVDLATEIVNQKIASYDYKANLRTIKVQDEIQQSLLDILS